MKKMLFILFAGFSLISPYVLASDCQTPTTHELQAFFEFNPHWTEVKGKSNQIAERRVIRVEINFSNPTRSQITMDGRSQGRIREVCIISEDRIAIVSSRGTAYLERAASGHLVAEIGPFQFYHLPDQLVVQ